MKKAALLLGAIASAGIGAIAAPSVAEAQPVTPSWTGFYVGGSGGGAWGSSLHDNVGVTTLIPHTSGAIAGGGAGYNWQSGPWVGGFETDLSWADVKGRANCGTDCTTKVESLGTARARLGFILGGGMPVYGTMPARGAPVVASYSGPLIYATGGFAYGHVHATDDFLTLSGTKWFTGWTAGGGIEWKLAGNWTAKLEYLYVDLGRKTFDGTFLGPTVEFVNAKTNVVRVGLSYQFATGAMPQR